MFGAFGGGLKKSFTFVSQAAFDDGIGASWGWQDRDPGARHARPAQGDMIHNGATPHMEVDPETYEVRADGRLLVCEPAAVLPLAQRYFLF
jgi:urease subunit alpha